MKNDATNRRHLPFGKTRNPPPRPRFVRLAPLDKGFHSPMPGGENQQPAGEPALAVVITLCCTHKVRSRLALPLEPSLAVEPTTRLGNWYVHRVQLGRQIVSRELVEMQTIIAAPATNRRVIGSTNKFAFRRGVHLERSSDPLALSLLLSETPMSAVGSKSHYGIPREVARALLASRGN